MNWFEIVKTAVGVAWVAATFGFIFAGWKANKDAEKEKAEYKKYWEDYYAKKYA